MGRGIGIVEGDEGESKCSNGDQATVVESN